MACLNGMNAANENENVAIVEVELPALCQTWEGYCD